MSQPPSSMKNMGKYVALAQVGMEMAAPIFLGWWLDSIWDTAPWLVITGAVLGFVGGLYHLVILLKRFDESESSNQ